MDPNRPEDSKRPRISVKDRLGPRIIDPSEEDFIQPDLKRQRQDDTALVHGLSAKFIQENVPRSSKDGSFRETQRNLLEMSKAQQLNVGKSGFSGTEEGEIVSAPSTVGKETQAMAESTVASFLESFGLSKYVDAFQAEEVDMFALGLINNDDLKEMRLPLGPRKKILYGIAHKIAKK